MLVILGLFLFEKMVIMYNWPSIINLKLKVRGKGLKNVEGKYTVVWQWIETLDKRSMARLEFCQENYRFPAQSETAGQKNHSKTNRSSYPLRIFIREFSTRMKRSFLWAMEGMKCFKILNFLSSSPPKVSNGYKRYWAVTWGSQKIEKLVTTSAWWLSGWKINQRTLI